jgi:hypothetical protein
MKEYPEYGIRLSNIKLDIEDMSDVEGKDVYIGRRNSYYRLNESDWHNPIKLKSEADRDLVFDQFREYIEARPDLIARLPELVGKNLWCWCTPKKCHGEVLVELLEKYHPNSKTLPEKVDFS